TQSPAIRGRPCPNVASRPCYRRDGCPARFDGLHAESRSAHRHDDHAGWSHPPLRSHRTEGRRDHNLHGTLRHRRWPAGRGVFHPRIVIAGRKLWDVGGCRYKTATAGPLGGLLAQEHQDDYGDHSDSGDPHRDQQRRPAHATRRWISLVAHMQVRQLTLLQISMFVRRLAYTHASTVYQPLVVSHRSDTRELFAEHLI